MMHQHPRKSESNSDVVRRDERGARVGGFSIWTQDESGLYDVSWLREYTACLAVCLCNVDLDSERNA